jgi:peroxiredoxin
LRSCFGLFNCSAFHLPGTEFIPLFSFTARTSTNTSTTEWADKKVVLFSVPGAFTPGCSVKHLPGYINNLSKLKEKGVDVVAVIAFNDSWVMSAWGKANGIKGDDIVGVAQIFKLK